MDKFVEYSGRIKILVYFEKRKFMNSESEQQRRSRVYERRLNLHLGKETGQIKVTTNIHFQDENRCTRTWGKKFLDWI